MDLVEPEWNDLGQHARGANLARPAIIADSFDRDDFAIARAGFDVSQLSRPATTPEPTREILGIRGRWKRPQWGIAVRQSEDEVFAAMRLLQARIFALLVIAIASALMLVYVTTPASSPPYRHSLPATQRIAQGIWKHRYKRTGKRNRPCSRAPSTPMRARLQDSMVENPRVES